MFIDGLKILATAFPFFKEMIFGKKTKVEKITGIALFLCFLISILFMIILNSFHYNLVLSKKNKTLMDENTVLQQTIEDLETNKLITFCKDGKELIVVLRENLKKTQDDLASCRNKTPNEKKRIDDVKSTLENME